MFFMLTQCTLVQNFNKCSKYIKKSLSNALRSHLIPIGPEFYKIFIIDFKNIISKTFSVLNFAQFLNFQNILQAILKKDYFNFLVSLTFFFHPYQFIQKKQKEKKCILLLYFLTPKICAYSNLSFNSFLAKLPKIINSEPRLKSSLGI